MRPKSLLAGFFILLFSMVMGAAAFASPGGDKAPVQKESVYKPVADVVASVATLNVFKSSYNLPEGGVVVAFDNCILQKSEKEAVFSSVPIANRYAASGTYLNRLRAAIYDRYWQRTKRTNKKLLYLPPPDPVERV